MKVAILSGSVYGTAEEVARHAEEILKDAGFNAWHNARATLADVQAFAPDAFLAVTSTTGMGELPDNLQPLYSTIRDQLPAAWRGLPRFRPTTQLAYGALMHSLLVLWRRHAALRRAAWAQGLLSVAMLGLMVIMAIDGILNEPLFVESVRIAPFKPRGTDVNVVLDLMIHDIEIIQHIVRSEVKRVDAIGAIEQQRI